MELYYPASQDFKLTPLFFDNSLVESYPVSHPHRFVEACVCSVAWTVHDGVTTARYVLAAWSPARPQLNPHASCSNPLHSVGLRQKRPGCVLRHICAGRSGDQFPPE